MDLVDIMEDPAAPEDIPVADTDLEAGCIVLLWVVARIAHPWAACTVLPWVAVCIGLPDPLAPRCRPWEAECGIALPGTVAAAAACSR